MQDNAQAMADAQRDQWTPPRLISLAHYRATTGARSAHRRRWRHPPESRDAGRRPVGRVLEWSPYPSEQTEISDDRPAA
jgi:hypothetical protein